MKDEHSPERSRATSAPSRPSRPARRSSRSLGTAALLLAGVMVFRWASTPELRAAVQQPVLRGRLRGRRPARRRRASPYELADGGGTDHGAAATRSTRPASRSAARACPAAAATAATRSSTSRTSPPRSSRSRPTSSGRWRASSPRRSRRSTASTPRSCTSRCRQKQVFADEQDPATASVLVDTAPGDDARPRAGAGDRAPRRLQHRRPRPRARSPWPTPPARVLSATDGVGGAGREHPRPAGRRTSRTRWPARSRRCSTASSARATRPSR